jgi:hypothetical protein
VILRRLFNYAILGNGNRPAGYHWVNFFLHSAIVLPVCVLMRRLLSGHTLRLQLNCPNQNHAAR